MKTDLLRWCSPAPKARYERFLAKNASDLERGRIPPRRMDRFFGGQDAGQGLCEAFAQRGDELVYFSHIVDWLTTADPDLSPQDVTKCFQLSLRYGAFGRRGSLGKVLELVDLEDFDQAQPGRYALRPFASTAAERPGQMMACKSTWARWLRGEALPLPGWLAGAPMIEGEATTIETSAAVVALPSAPTGMRSNRAADAETAAREWLRVRQGQPKMTKAGALEAIKATIDKGPLSDAAFRRAWEANADSRWKEPGAPKKKIP